MLSEAGWSRAKAATAFARVAAENGATELALIGRSHIQAWVEGAIPEDPRTPVFLAQAFSRRLGRPVPVSQLGFGTKGVDDAGNVWDADTLIALADLGRADLSIDRRRALSVLAFQAGALASPASLSRPRGARPTPVSPHTRRVGAGDLEAVRDMSALFSAMDQRRGGGHGRSAVVQYLVTEVEPLLHGSFVTDELRRQTFSAAGELAYLAGWMAFDAAEHGLAQRYFAHAVKLATEAENHPLSGHVLRAMAHQANDLGHHRAASRIAAASVEGARYREACRREQALLGVVHARTLATTGDPKGAARALNQAEDDLASADARDTEPRRVWFFGEASLAHETACTLRDLGDLEGALRQFRRSVRTRQTAFPRTHAVTLGYQGAIQAQQGSIEQACDSWTRALDLMDGVRSGRTAQTARQMREALSPYRPRGIRAVHEVDSRAATYLAQSV
ncbi:Tat pathway signal protein [Kitasatospora cystarginea]